MLEFGNPELDDSIEKDQQQIEFEKRQQDLIKEGHFIEPYKAELKELFHALDLDDQWSENPAEMLPYIRTKWIGKEHGNSPDKAQFTPDQVAAAMPIIERLGLKNELLPPQGSHFDEIVVLGGLSTANYRRVKFIVNLLQNYGVTADKVVFLVGQRMRMYRDGTDKDLLGSDEGKFPGNDMTEHPWIQHMLADVEAKQAKWEEDQHQRHEQSLEGPVGRPYPQIVPYETDNARLMMHKVVHEGEQLSPSQIRLNVTDVTGMSQAEAEEAVPKQKNFIEPPETTEFFYKVPIQVGDETREQTFAFIKAAAVDRLQPGSTPRPTVASQTAEWLQLDPPAKKVESLPGVTHIQPREGNPKVLLVSGNPHTLRTAYDFNKMVEAEGRGDIVISVAGTDTSLNVIQSYLGEIGRMIDNDFKDNYQTAGSVDQ